MVKKVLLFLALVFFRDGFQVQVKIVYYIFGLQFLLGVALRPFRSLFLNVFRALSDICIVIYFVVLELSDKKVRDLDNLSLEERQALGEEDLK